jgi:hypothetical protein
MMNKLFKPLTLVLLSAPLGLPAGRAQTVIPFESTNTVSAQPTNQFLYFQVVVPATVLGWDVRIQNVTSGDPRLSIRRDLPPDNLKAHDAAGKTWDPYSTNLWPTKFQAVPDRDWTGYRLDANYSNRVGHIFQVGMGNPLEPGTYYIGITNGIGLGHTNALSYTLVSRGIGTNFSIPIVSLPWTNGSVSISALASAEPAYYSVEVPENVPSWKTKLSVTGGEALLMLQRGALPNIGASIYNSSPGIYGGKLLQKTGDEVYLLLPDEGATNIPSGTYYLGVVGEGNNPAQPGLRLGTGTSSCTLSTFGSATAISLGTVDPSGLTDLVSDNNSQGGEAQPFQFVVPPGTASVEVFLENRVGNPVMTLRPDDQLPWPPESYGRDGGQVPSWASFKFIYLPNVAPATYTLMMTASSFNGSYPDASYRIRVHSYPNSPSLFLTPPGYSTGTFFVDLEMNTNVNYRIQASSDLTNWTTITNLLSPNLTNTIIDPNAGSHPYRFYRAVTP